MELFLVIIGWIAFLVASLNIGVTFVAFNRLSEFDQAHVEININKGLIVFVVTLVAGIVYYFT